MSDTLLIVEDDENLRIVLEDNLTDYSYRVHTADTCQSAMNVVNQQHIDLILLDIMLPDGSGYDLCQTLRKQGYAGRILMLTARSLEDDVVQGLRGGADDYLTKPYRLRELLARIDVLLQRNNRDHHSVRKIEFGNCTIDLDSRRVTIIVTETISGQYVSQEHLVELTRKEFDLLLVLASEPGIVKSRETLLNTVWGERVIVDNRTIDNFVSNLRKKLRWTPQSPFSLVSVRGVGYRLDINS